jgi:hypothetical protein
MRALTFSRIILKTCLGIFFLALIVAQTEYDLILGNGNIKQKKIYNSTTL